MAGTSRTNTASSGWLMESIETESPDLWLDRVTRMIGFGWLAERIPGDLPASYLYTIVTVVVSNVLTISYSILNNIPLIYRENPYFAIQPFILVGAIYGAHTLQVAYHNAMTEMRIRERADNPESLLDPVPS